MTAGTGDGDRRTCGECMNDDYPTMGSKYNYYPNCPQKLNWTPKPQPQVAPLDIPAMLVAMIYTLDKAIDQSPYDKEKDALIDAMEQLQVAAKVSAEVAQFEDQEDYPLAPGVPMR